MIRKMGNKFKPGLKLLVFLWGREVTTFLFWHCSATVPVCCLGFSDLHFVKS